METDMDTDTTTTPPKIGSWRLETEIDTDKIFLLIFKTHSPGQVILKFACHGEYILQNIIHSNIKYCLQMSKSSGLYVC